MICVKTPRNGGGDAFAFETRLDATTRGMEAMETLCAAPWRAWWAVVFETLDAKNYRL